ncbi:uncharacterized protein RAG0_15457 [Rhynchosporium agropyri]|uniref:Uncharacterized protein n=1 Tax=Rhynchosporium agropyri TaxID=914238 RepID=A0A1E1LLC8_9HELO|nr:uncharacterized protein RAG0_15457 [Rhynchosporium agropyri]
MATPPRESTTMDIDTLRQVIADMQKELRDRAIGDHEKDVFYINWKFKDDEDSAYSFDHHQTTKRYKDGGGLPSEWEDSALENLYRGLTDGRVRAVALDEEKQILGESSAWDMPKKTSAKIHRLPDRLRDRMIATIETAIGRQLIPRSAKLVDPRKSDPKPPNLYKWQFSDGYPDFPAKTGGISRWNSGQIQACFEALDKQHLIVVNVDPDSIEALESPKIEVEEVDPSEIDRSLNTLGSEKPSTDSPTPSNRPNSDKTSFQSPARDVLRPVVVPASSPVIVSVEEEQAKLIQVPFKGIEGAKDQISNILNGLLKDQVQELKHKWEARHTSAQNGLRAATENSEQKLQAEHEAHRKTLSNLLPLQREGEKLRTKLAQLERDLAGGKERSQIEAERLRAKMIQLEQDLDEKVSLARIEGRQFMNDGLLKDLSSAMEEELRILRLAHFEQLVKVRAESYELGVLAGKKKAAIPSTAASSSQATSDLESLEIQHEEDLKLARKGGRKTAYLELSLGLESSLDDVLGTQAESTSNRKIRELMTIHQNWHDIPQRVLPSHMLPEGHSPSAETLHLLAKLSKEVDGVAASKMLTKHIDQRCANSNRQPEDRFLTDRDLLKVLGRNTSSSLSEATSPDLVRKVHTPLPIAENQINESQSTVQQTSQISTEVPNDESPQKCHGIFDQYDEEHLVSRHKATAPITPLTSAATTTAGHEMLISSNPPLLGSLSNPPKRSSTDVSTVAAKDPKRHKTYATSVMPARIQEVHLPEENGHPSFPVSASDIFADSPKKVKAIPNIRKDKGGEDEDMYGTSPPRETRRRAGTKKVDGA